MANEIRITLLQAYRNIRTRLDRPSQQLEDALQEAFCKLWSQQQDDGDALQGEMRKQLKMETKRLKRHPQTELSAHLAAESRADTESNELYQQVMALAKKHLTDLQLQIMQRRDMENESYGSIAQDLGMSESAVRMQLSRARCTLREVYKERKKNMGK